MNQESELIIALDTPSLKTAENIIANTVEYCNCYKVGLELFAAYGPKAIELVKKFNADVFLDLKLHDIPNTVAKTIKQVLKYDVQFLTLHALAGPLVLKAAALAVKEEQSDMQLLAVSVLTHHSNDELKTMGFTQNAAALAMDLVEHAVNAGIYGAVCSPHEASLLKTRFGEKMTLVCPGIRPTGSALNDQSRIATPEAALHNGASHLVVGRPITEAANMKQAAFLVNQEIRDSLNEKTPF